MPNLYIAKKRQLNNIMGLARHGSWDMLPFQYPDGWERGYGAALGACFGTGRTAALRLDRFMVVRLQGVKGSPELEVLLDEVLDTRGDLVTDIRRAASRIHTAIRMAAGPEPAPVPAVGSSNTLAEIKKTEGELLERERALKADLEGMALDVRAHQQAQDRADAVAKAIEQHLQVRPHLRHSSGGKLNLLRDKVENSREELSRLRAVAAYLEMERKEWKTKVDAAQARMNDTRKHAGPVAERIAKIGDPQDTPPLCPLDCLACPRPAEEWQERIAVLTRHGETLRTAWEETKTERDAAQAVVDKIAREWKALDWQWIGQEESREVAYRKRAESHARMAEWTRVKRGLDEDWRAANERKKKTPLPAGYNVVSAELALVRSRLDDMGSQALGVRGLATKEKYTRLKANELLKKFRTAALELPERERQAEVLDREWWKVLEKHVESFNASLVEVLSGTGTMALMRKHATYGWSVVLTSIASGMSSDQARRLTAAAQQFAIWQAAAPSFCTPLMDCTQIPPDIAVQICRNVEKARVKGAVVALSAGVKPPSDAWGLLP